MQQASVQLFDACMREDVERVTLLLQQCAASCDAVMHGTTPLFIACTLGNEACASLLLEVGAAVDNGADDNATPLFVACQEGYEACASLLLQHDAAVNKTNDDGVTPLFIACCNAHEGCVRLLLEKDASAVDLATNNGRTPLFIACCYANMACARLLLQQGAQVDLVTEYNDYYGDTPLFIACRAHNLPCVQLLSSYGSSRTRGDNLDAASFVSAYRPTSPLTISRLDNLSAWLALSHEWISPLHHLEIIGAPRARDLLRAGASLDAVAHAGGPTPLGLARALRATNQADEGSAADLVLRASEPWSQENHHLFPAAARVRAVRLMWTGALLLHQPHVDNALRDVWRQIVIPRAVNRSSDM
jgi:ankyrin repeat protein